MEATTGVHLFHFEVVAAAAAAQRRASWDTVHHAQVLLRYGIALHGTLQDT